MSPRYYLFSGYLALSGLVSLYVSSSRVRDYRWGQRLYQYVPTLCFMAAIYWISSFSFVTKTKAFLPDYVYHVLAFTAFGFLCLRMLSLNRPGPPTPSSFAVSLLFCAGYAGLDEIHQLYVPGRSCSLKDLFCDVGGAIAGMTAYVWLVRKASETRSKAEGEKVR